MQRFVGLASCFVDTEFVRQAVAYRTYPRHPSLNPEAGEMASERETVRQRNLHRYPFHRVRQEPWAGETVVLLATSRMKFRMSEELLIPHYLKYFPPRNVASLSAGVLIYNDRRKKSAIFTYKLLNFEL